MGQKWEWDGPERVVERGIGQNVVRMNYESLDQFGYVSLSILVTARSSGILKVKQKLGVTFNSDKLGGIAFTKISKLTMCSA